MGKNMKVRKTSAKEIVFDEDKRRDFLTGFRKRKNERRQFARNKIAEEVRKERLEERKERREFKKTLRGGAAGAAEEAEEANGNDSGDSDDEGDERTTYQDGDTLTTTVVSSLLGDDEMQLQQPPERKPAPAPKAAARPQKKFNLSKSLTEAIPGYVAPSGLQKKRKIKRKPAVLSKKAKAQHRAPKRH